jgi:ER-bound oxygenase mpaB/B'/Rubber oxygenase, catalytic domain
MESEFVGRHSIVRRIWGDPDLVLLIFAGGAAEFALNRAVDWLFFTGRIPGDPLGRLFSTVHYAQQIVFASAEQARATMESITAIHAEVESRRGQRIPHWAHRDVLYMLIDYSRRAYELMYSPMTSMERDMLYATFLRLGIGLRIPDLPTAFGSWLQDREVHLNRDLAYSNYTALLFERYRRQLGPWRYRLLLELQALLVPAQVGKLLKLRSALPLGRSSVRLYAQFAQFGLQPLAHRVLIPPRYWHDVSKLKDPMN